LRKERRGKKSIFSLWCVELQLRRKKEEEEGLAFLFGVGLELLRLLGS